jgi:hypothetical protein
MTAKTLFFAITTLAFSLALVALLGFNQYRNNQFTGVAARILADARRIDADFKPPQDGQATATQGVELCDSRRKALEDLQARLTHTKCPASKQDCKYRLGEALKTHADLYRVLASWLQQTPGLQGEAVTVQVEARTYYREAADLLHASGRDVVTMPERAINAFYDAGGKRLERRDARERTRAFLQAFENVMSTFKQARADMTAYVAQMKASPVSDQLIKAMTESQRKRYDLGRQFAGIESPEWTTSLRDNAASTASNSGDACDLYIAYARQKQNYETYQGRSFFFFTYSPPDRDLLDRADSISAQVTTRIAEMETQYQDQHLSASKDPEQEPLALSW